MKSLSPILLVLLLFPTLAKAEAVTVGVNFVNPQWLSTEAQNATLTAMHAAGVTVIRCPVLTDAKGLDFAQRAFAQGIKIDMIPRLEYRPDAPDIPRLPDYPEVYGGHPLSYADPDLFRAKFQPFLAQLEAKGITLAAIELGNEINWCCFNAEFPVPGQGRYFGYDDLYQDPEAMQVARGFLQYLKVLAVLKDIRDHSKLNRHTPVLCAGLACGGPSGPAPRGQKLDGVALDATLRYLRANGLDNLVDGYAVHTYPSGKNPGDPAADAGRIEALNRYVFPPGNAKPYWVTEWGFPTKAESSEDDQSRVILVKEMRAYLQQLAQQGRLRGSIYFCWNDDLKIPKAVSREVYKNGALMEAGRIAIAPMSVP